MMILHEIATKNTFDCAFYVFLHGLYNNAQGIITLKFAIVLCLQNTYTLKHFDFWYFIRFGTL